MDHHGVIVVLEGEKGLEGEVGPEHLDDLGFVVVVEDVEVDELEPDLATAVVFGAHQLEETLGGDVVEIEHVVELLVLQDVVQTLEALVTHLVFKEGFDPNLDVLYPLLGHLLLFEIHLLETLPHIIKVTDC